MMSFLGQWSPKELSCHFSFHPLNDSDRRGGNLGSEVMASISLLGLGLLPSLLIEW